MRKCLSRFALAAAAVMVAACTGGPETYPTPDYTVRIDGFYNDGAADRDLRLVVIGDPFPGVPDEVFKQAVETDLQSSSVLGRAPTHVTLNPGVSAKSYYRLIYAFGQPYDLYGNALCQADPRFARPVPANATVRATAAFCVGGEAETFVWGNAEATGPGDVRLAQLTRQMMDNVFRPDFKPAGSQTNTNTRIQ